VLAGVEPFFNALTLKDSEMRRLGTLDLGIGYLLLLVSLPLFFQFQLAAGMGSGPPSETALIISGNSSLLQFIAWVAIVGGLILSGHRLRGGSGRWLAWAAGPVSLTLGIIEVGLGIAGILPGDVAYVFGALEIVVGALQFMLFRFAASRNSETDL
jgi:hypothetical protein